MLSSLTNSPLFETIICLILAFALLSLLVSTLTEVVNSYFNERGQQLYIVISRMFDDGLNVNFGQLLYSHPMITNIRKDTNSLPQYISNNMFSQVLIDVIGNYGRSYKFDAAANAIALQNDPGKGAITDPFLLFQAGVNNMKHTDLKLMLMNMVEKSASLSGKELEQRLAQLDGMIQQWYNDQMDRTSGWFKDLMRKRLLIISLLVAVGLNVDSIHLFKNLYTHPTLRSQLLPVAEVVADNLAKAKTDTTLTALQQVYNAVAASSLKHPGKDSSYAALHGILRDLKEIDSLQQHRDSTRIANLQTASDILDDLAGLNIPIGWHNGIPPLNLRPRTPEAKRHWEQASSWDRFGTIAALLFWYVLGIAITAFSISAGAPFWFDLLLKLVNIRRAGKKPES
ncbi:MAG TPA: hypothetical protein VKQ52_13330 [Puia sp.]|nr:hypothetical protein [Puia sp.]